MSSKKGPPAAAGFAAVILACIALISAGCSAIELYRSNAGANDEAAAGLAATQDPTVSALEGGLAEARATEQALLAGATHAAATIAARSPMPAAADEAFPLPASAEISLYGAVPIDSDGLNIIAALAFEADGRLLAATRAGEIYALPDADGDGIADETRLIFADDGQELGQVAGLAVHGRALILLHGDGLSLLRDIDGDGLYETATPLAAGLPLDRSPLRASNGLVQSADGRLFSVDLDAGEILRIEPVERATSVGESAGA